MFNVLSWTLIGEFYPSAEMQSVYSATPTDWTTKHSLVGILPLCRNAVGVFYNPSRLGHRIPVGGDLNTLQRCSWCILQPQPTGSQNTRWWGSYLSAEDAVCVFYNPSRLGHRTPVGRDLNPLQRYNRCILQPQPIGPQDTRRWGS